MTDLSFAHARPERDRDHTMRVYYTCVKEGGVVRVRMRVQNLRARRKENISLGLLPKKMKNEWNKWKNHFYEMKGDVGMSLHEKERNKKMPT